MSSKSLPPDDPSVILLRWIAIILVLLMGLQMFVNALQQLVPSLKQVAQVLV